MDVAYLRAKMSIYLAWKAQIALLLAEKFTIPNDYLEFANVFSKKSAIELPKYFNINKHTIDLEPGKQPSYILIYSLGPVELKTLKKYIKTNLANSSIWPSKSPTGASISFVQKLDGSLCLCSDYCSLNNLTIKQLRTNIRYHWLVSHLIN